MTQDERSIPFKKYQAIGRMEEFDGYEEQRRREAMAFQRFCIAATARGKIERFISKSDDLGLFPAMGHLEDCWGRFCSATANAAHKVAWSYFVRTSGWLVLPVIQADVRPDDHVARLEALTKLVLGAQEQIPELSRKSVA